MGSAGIARCGGSLAESMNRGDRKYFLCRVPRKFRDYSVNRTVFFMFLVTRYQELKRFSVVLVKSPDEYSLG
jgi:hypothetical protein